MAWRCAASTTMDSNKISVQYREKKVQKKAISSTVPALARNRRQKAGVRIREKRLAIFGQICYNGSIYSPKGEGDAHHH
jgi:hypothetical protein